MIMDTMCGARYTEVGNRLDHSSPLEWSEKPAETNQVMPMFRTF
jgi:hypothetical protein